MSDSIKKRQKELSFWNGMNPSEEFFPEISDNRALSTEFSHLFRFISTRLSWTLARQAFSTRSPPHGRGNAEKIRSTPLHSDPQYTSREAIKTQKGTNPIFSAAATELFSFPPHTIPLHRFTVLRFSFPQPPLFSSSLGWQPSRSLDLSCRFLKAAEWLAGWLGLKRIR